MCGLVLADVSTDGHWCFVVFWVVPRSSSIKVRWASLKNRLMSMCPSSYSIPFYRDVSQPEPGPLQFYLLKLMSPDRKGLLHGNYLCPHSSMLHQVFKKLLSERYWTEEY